MTPSRGDVEPFVRFDEIAIKTDPLSHSAHRIIEWHYPLAGKWDELRHVAKQFLERGQRTDYWALRPPMLNFLQYGNKELFLSEMENVTEFPAASPFPLWKSSWKRSSMEN